jgi:uncharacterized membrane protein YjfL (UPF0719 family)
MDIYSKVILAMACFNALVVAAWVVYLSATSKREIDSIKAKNAAATLTPLNYENWLAERLATNQRKAKAIAEFQALRELNGDINAVLEGE